MINLNKPQSELEKDLETLSPGSSEYELIRSKIDRIQQNTNNVQTAHLIDEMKTLRKTMIDLDKSNSIISRILGIFALVQIIIAGFQLAFELSVSTNIGLAICIAIAFIVTMGWMIRRFNLISERDR